MKNKFVRRIVVFEDHFIIFRKTLDRETLKKVYYVLSLIMVLEVVPSQYLKAIKGRKGLYEIRIEHSNSIYRVFCCFDDGHIVVLLNGFQKKKQKTPAEMLDKAETLMKKYFALNNKQDNG